MNDKVLNRAKQKIDYNDYIRLFNLQKEYKWLEYEPEALFDLWCLSENDEQKNTIEFLINNFLFIDGYNLHESTQKIANHIEKVWNLKAKNTFIVATCDNSNPDGSQYLIQRLKNKFSTDWRESHFFNSLPVGANEIPNNSTIILIDDFIGTGNTISRKLDYVKKTIIDRGLNVISIKVVSLATMKFAEVVLSSHGVDYFSVHWLNKGISELVPTDKKEVATKAMEELENKLQKKYRGRKLPNFGYKRSESLFALGFNNIPNNVFPIFWWPLLKEEYYVKQYLKEYDKILQ